MHKITLILMVIAFAMQAVLPVSAECSRPCRLQGLSAADGLESPHVCCCGDRSQSKAVTVKACCSSVQIEAKQCSQNSPQQCQTTGPIITELGCLFCQHCQPAPAGDDPSLTSANISSWLNQLELSSNTIMEILVPARFNSQQGRTFWASADNGNRYYGRVLLNLADCVWRK